ncbi:hypothetical protein ACI79G_08815 [Geodermatophilus sp. SYSU D00779]
MPALTVPARFCGPPGTADGGWLAGTPAALVDAPAVSVRLRRPVPLDRLLSVRTDGAAELHDDAELLAAEAPGPLLLGTITARQERPVPVDAGCVLLAWVLQRDSRRSTTASALVGPDGAVAARARAVWSAAR